MAATTSDKTATIASGQTVGAAFCIGAHVPVSIRIPGTITGANLSFQGSHDNSTYQAIYSGASAYSVPMTASKDVALDASKFAGYRYLKLVSDAAEGADRTFTVFCRRGDR